MFTCSPTLSTTFISHLSYYELLYFHFLKLSSCFTLLELFLSISSLFSTMIENDFFNLHHFHLLDLRFSSRYMLDAWLGSQQQLVWFSSLDLWLLMVFLLPCFLLCVDLDILMIVLLYPNSLGLGMEQSRDLNNWYKSPMLGKNMLDPF